MVGLVVRSIFVNFKSFKCPLRYEIVRDWCMYLQSRVMVVSMTCEVCCEGFLVVFGRGIVWGEGHNDHLICVLWIYLIFRVSIHGVLWRGGRLNCILYVYLEGLHWSLHFTNSNEVKKINVVWPLVLWLGYLGWPWYVVGEDIEGLWLVDLRGGW
jgi:hypothetical protein